MSGENGPTGGVPEAAVRVIHEFVAAGKRGDAEAMKACLTRATLESGAFRSEQPPGVDFIVGEGVWEEGKVLVPLKVVPEGAGPDAEALDELPCLVVEEDGAWKFDLAATIDRKMGGMQAAMEQAMKQMGEAMAGAMSGLGEAMQEAFGGESGDGRESWDDVAEPDPATLTPLREMMELARTREAIAGALGFDVPVRADIAGFMRLFGVEEADTLRNWFDEQLLVNWAGMLAPVKNCVPLEGRLTGIRFEPAQSVAERFLAVDGTELLYRLDPRSQEGFYSDEEIGAMLLAVLAGVPRHGEAVEGAEGKSFVPSEDAIPSVHEYEAVANWWMKRISGLLGRYVALEADWYDLGAVCYTARPLYVWGLNRVYGALAAVDAIWAPGDLEARGALDSLRVVRFRGVYTPEERRAVLEDGVLEVAVAPLRDEAGGLYEHQIAGAFTGNPIDPLRGESGEGTDGEGADPEIAAMMEAGESGEGADLSDPYVVAAEYMDRLEGAMKEVEMWPGEAPEPLEVRGAFGCENMAYEQWLGWVLVPNVRRIVEERGSFPSSSSVGAYAVREFDGRDEAAEVVSILASFDAYVNGLAEGGEEV